MYSNGFKEQSDQWNNEELPGSLRIENNSSGFLEQDLKSLRIPGTMGFKEEREAGRLQRARLSSIDGDTAEEHDQFYRDHKLLLVLFRALAVMPITRSSPGKIMKFLTKCEHNYLICRFFRESYVQLEIWGFILRRMLLYSFHRYRFDCWI